MSGGQDDTPNKFNYSLSLTAPHLIYCVMIYDGRVGRVIFINGYFSDGNSIKLAADGVYLPWINYGQGNERQLNQTT
jgi:cystathionine beta-lyase family protein involved in aluminum resistance